MKRRWEQEAAAEQREAARAERVREQLNQQRYADNIAASIALAEQRGQEFDLREALQHGVARTHQEVLAWASAQADLEDARVEAARRKRLRQLELQESESWSGDTTAPASGEMDVSQLEQSPARDAKVREQLARRAKLRGEWDEARYQASVQRRLPAHLRRIER